MLGPFTKAPFRMLCDMAAPGAEPVMLPYGSPEYIGLGFSVMFMLVLIELFGSPFLKNCNVVMGLIFGVMLAASDYKGTLSASKGNPYMSEEQMKEAEGGNFLWTDTFPLGVYAPAIFPIFVCFIVTTVETIGDIGAVYDASEEPIDTDDHKASVQGGLLSDGLASFFSALATSMPNTTFSQNNGVIALTKCASRTAGVATGLILIFCGIIEPIAAFFTSIPDAVLGGMTTFCFCQVFISGLGVVSKCDLNSRRIRMILGISMGVGIGVACVPHVFNDYRASPYTNAFWPCTDCSDAKKGWRNGILIFLGTPYCIGPALAMILNFILPEDLEVVSKDKSTPADPAYAT